MHRSSLEETTIQKYRMGPLASCVDAYLTSAKQGHFSALTVVDHLRALRRFSLWLRDAHVDFNDVDEGTIQRFVTRPREGVYKREPAILKRVIGILRGQGRLKEIVPSHVTIEQQLTRDYSQYLSRERGLSEATIINYVWAAQELLAVYSARGPLVCSSLVPSDLTAFVQHRARRMPPERARLLVTGLRSFMRYLRHRGEIASDLAACIPAVANWTLSTLPKYLPAGAAQQVIKHCDQNSPIGKRNYAILLLLARLGLRAGEIVSLNLEDIDWAVGRMTIHGKGGRCAQVPLLADIGEAVASYLHAGRPQCQCRSVFVRHVAPVRGFASSAMISTIVNHALTAAGVHSTRKGAHVFRHTLATDLLRQGVSLEEIGELLRHRSPNTTAIYAKLPTLLMSAPYASKPLDI